MNDSEQTEGELLAALGSFSSYSPFGHSHMFVSTFPVNGDSFLSAVKKLPIKGEPISQIFF